MWLSEYDPRLLELYDISYMKKEKVLGWLELKEVEKVFDIVIVCADHRVVNVVCFVVALALLSASSLRHLSFIS